METAAKRRLTVKQLHKACQQNRYLLATHVFGFIIGVNCKVSDIILKRKAVSPYKQTQWLSVKPCGFQEYLSNKTPFINTED